jgi:hypothetical protein
MARNHELQTSEQPRPWARPRFSGVDKSNILSTKRSRRSLEKERTPKMTKTQGTVEILEEEDQAEGFNDYVQPTTLSGVSHAHSVQANPESSKEETSGMFSFIVSFIVLS